MEEATKSFIRALPTILMFTCTWVTPLFAGNALTGKVLTINQAVSLALANNPALFEASEREKAAKAQIEDVRANREVQLKLESRKFNTEVVSELTPFPGRQSIKLGEKEFWNSTLTAQKILSSGGKIEAAINQAKSSAEAVRLMSFRTEQLIAFEAEQAFLQVISAQRQTEVAQQALSTADEYHRVALSRFKARAATRFEVLRAEVQREESHQELIKAQSFLQIAQASLMQALAVRTETLVATETGLVDSIPNISVDEAIQLAFSRRPDLKTLQWQIEAAKAGISAARSEIRPTLSLVADYQKFQRESLTQINRWTTVFTVGIPLVDGGHYRARIKGAKAALGQQNANMEACMSRIEKEVRQALARITSAVSQVKVAKKRVELAQEMLRLTHVRYSSGISTPTEVADTQTALTRARQGLVQAITGLRIAQAEFRLATGEPVPNEEQPTSEREKP